MAIIHRYINELENIEKNQVFCNKPINLNSKILLIGTFNPSDESCLKANQALWFYGRQKNNFWKYLPTALTGESLHFNKVINDLPNVWKDYCVSNKIVIIDLIKSISINEKLSNFGDKEVDSKISDDLQNTDYFNIKLAFHDIKFEMVIYSLAWSDTTISRIRKIRDIINYELVINKCIESNDQIKYCLTPSRNDDKTRKSWFSAINSNNNSIPSLL